MKCEHDFVAVVFVFASYWECHKCGHRPEEAEWDRWVARKAVTA